MKTMTPKEKAKEIYCKYADALNIRDLQTTANPFVKQCALMAVEEILNNNCGSRTDEANATNSEIYCDEYFWNNVKSELQSF
jgi:hypothetical protein